MAKKYNRDLILNGSMLSAILSLAIPVVINSFLQTMYNLTDTYWLGHIGKEELAAINLVTPVQNIVINFGTGITVAGSVLIAQYIGARRQGGTQDGEPDICLCDDFCICLCGDMLCHGSGDCFMAWSGWGYLQVQQAVSADSGAGYAVSVYDKYVYRT